MKNELVGISDDVKRKIDEVLKTNLAVLICGQTGTGRNYRDTMLNFIFYNTVSL